VALGAEVGGVVAVGAELVRLDVAGEGNEEVVAAPREAEVPAERPAAPVTKAAPKAPASTEPAALSTPASRAPIAPPRPPDEKPLASPAVRRRARDAGVDLRQVRGTGPAGRIGHDDLDAFLRGTSKAVVATVRAANTDVETVKIIGLRR